MSEYKFKNLSEINTVAKPAEGTTIMGFENGAPIQMPMSSIKGSRGVFIIDPDDPEYSTTDTAYGDKIKEAILNGNMVWQYFSSENMYSPVIAFGQFDNSGSQELEVTIAIVKEQSNIAFNKNLIPTIYSVSK